MTNFNELLSAIPTSDLARQVGASEEETQQAVEAALPALLGGLTANAKDRGGASSLLSALTQHEDGLTDATSVPLDRVDTADGQKIVGHIFGGNADDVVHQLGGIGGQGGGDLVRRLLPILAPIVLSWLAKQVGGSLGGSLGEVAQAPQSGGGPDLTSVLQDVLGSALGGATGQQPSSGGNILSDVLGGLLRGRG